VDASHTNRVNRQIESALSGGHPNSLGNVPQITAEVLTDKRLLSELLGCYHSQDAVVRLRVSSVLKRVCQQRPHWVLTHLEQLLNEVAQIDQASTKWTLAIVFGLLRERMNETQYAESLGLLKSYISYPDWIVQNTAMKVLQEYCDEDEILKTWLKTQLIHMQNSDWKSVAGRAKKLLATL